MTGRAGESTQEKGRRTDVLHIDPIERISLVLSLVRLVHRMAVGVWVEAWHS